jgi:hypothetical protein
MSESGSSTTGNPGTVPLRASHRGETDLAQAIEALTDLAWLGPQADAPADRPDLRRVRADLELPVGDGSAPGPIKKAALIDIGTARAVEGALLVEVSWRSASMAPLFPVFAGELRITATGLALQGRYVPPFGTLGLVIDAGILRFVARRTAQAFLTRFAARLGSRVP